MKRKPAGDAKADLIVGSSTADDKHAPSITAALYHWPKASSLNKHFLAYL